ncbi:DUF1203 domain-containing protein [Paroceanicella profunda]|uniref:DUF1203 domain-containing protein n=1 Tax=Paroceanicella profunda TaxID=2579971 RepID=A0A5B8FHB4_9RHOB|nr:DUF1203 domain-containing protein [Paroceanicella profunda]QDL91808.1 DUF1203 domain-containing protein [Paroceanicella profunda]
MSFRITGLAADPFLPLYGLDTDILAARGILRMTAGAAPDFPDRVELRHAREGETVLLLNHVSQPAASPYRATLAIFVIEGAETAYDRVDTVPEVMRPRLLSLRGFDEEGMMRDADVVEGTAVEGLIDRLFEMPEITEIHAHYARRGCFAGRITRG